MHEPVVYLVVVDVYGGEVISLDDFFVARQALALGFE